MNKVNEYIIIFVLMETFKKMFMFFKFILITFIKRNNRIRINFIQGLKNIKKNLQILI